MSLVTSGDLTRKNSNSAVLCSSARALSESWIPASSTMIRRLPCFWIVGSETPN